MNDLKKLLDRQLSMTQWTADNTQNVLSSIRKEEPEMKRAFPAALVAALLLIILTTAAVLAETQWGVLDWLFPSSARPVPIETAVPTVLEANGPESIAICLSEAVSDGYGLYVSVLCTPQEENTLLLNASLDPNRHLANEIGAASASDDQTIAAWARAQGFTAIRSVHLFSDAHSETASKQETFDSRVSAAMRLLDDGSSLILLAGSDLPGDGPYELTYTTIPYIAHETDESPVPVWTLSEKTTDQQTGTLRFGIQKNEAKNIRRLASYLPDEDQPDGPLQIRRAELLQSPFASYFLVAYTVREDMEHVEMLPVFGPSMPSDGSQPFSWPDLFMHGRKAQRLADGAMEYTYFCPRKINYLPDAFEIGGAFGLTPDAWTALSPVWMIRQDP